MRRWIAILTATAMMATSCATGEYRSTVTLERTMRIAVAIAGNPEPEALPPCLERCAGAGAGRATCLASCPGAEVAWGACSDLPSPKAYACIETPRSSTQEVDGPCSAARQRFPDHRVLDCTETEARSSAVGVGVVVAGGLLLLLWFAIRADWSH